MARRGDSTAESEETSPGPAGPCSTCRPPTSGRWRRPRPSRRRLDPRPRGRGGPGRQAGRTRQRLRGRCSPGSTAGVRSPSASTPPGPSGTTTTWPPPAPPARRPRRAQGRQRRRRARPRRRHGAPRRARPHEAVSDGRDAVRDAARARDRLGLRPAHRARHGHQRPRQGAVRRARARTPAAPDRAGPGPAGGAGGRQGHRRRRLQRREEHRGLPRRVPSGPRDGLRRQDAHPSRAGRRRQRGLRPVGEAVEDARGILQAWEDGRAPAWSPTTAGWSRTCASSPPSACWRCTRRSPRSRPTRADPRRCRRVTAHCPLGTLATCRSVCLPSYVRVTPFDTGDRGAE